MDVNLKGSACWRLQSVCFAYWTSCQYSLFISANKDRMTKTKRGLSKPSHQHHHQVFIALIYFQSGAQYPGSVCRSALDTHFSPSAEISINHPQLGRLPGSLKPLPATSIYLQHLWQADWCPGTNWVLSTGYLDWVQGTNWVLSTGYFDWV